MRKEAFGLEPETMYALVKERADKGLTLKKVPVPEAGPGDVKIKGNTAQKSRRDTARRDIIRPWINR